MTDRLLLFTKLTLVSLCLTPLAGFATDEFGERVDVEIVNVEVWVTDRNGEPVTGLPAEAFEVEEDGGPMDLHFFDEVRSSPPAGDPASLSPTDAAQTTQDDPAASVTASDTPTASASTARPATAGDTAGHMVIYFDETFLTSRGRTSLIENLQDFLETGSVEPERILVLRQDESLYVEAPFGSSLEEVQAAVGRLAEPRTGFSSPDVERQLAIQSLQQAWRVAQQQQQGGDATLANSGIGHPACVSFVRGAMRSIGRSAEVSRQRINSSLQHLHAVAGFLSAISGVKSLVYASDSLEMEPGSGLMAFVEGLCPGQTLGNSHPALSGELDEAFRRLSRGAAANRVTFYGLQPSGLQANVALSANNESFEARSVSRYQSTLRTAERAGHSYLAKETGGRTVFNTNDLLDDLKSIAREMNSYYSLGYAPDHPGDGLEHTIRVRLADEFDHRGMQVRHRRGYQHKTADTRLGERLQAALFMGLGENPMGVRLGAEAPPDTADARQRKPKFVVPLHVYVPVKAVTFVPGADATAAEIFVQVVWRDSRARKPEVRSKTWKINGPADENGLLDLTLDLDLAGGLNTVAVAVRDESSRETSYVSTTVALPTEAPGPASPQAVGSSPGR